MNHITYNGRSTLDFYPPILVQKYPDYTFPKRDYEAKHVPGRNGDILIDKESFSDSKITYSLAVALDGGNYYNMINSINNWLHSSNTYAKLSDSFSPEYYRMAYFCDEGTISNVLNQAGTISVTFKCKPQRYFYFGDYATTITSSPYSMTNPNMYTARPIIKVYGTGSGTLTVGDISIVITDIDDYIIIDSETDNAYKDNYNKNNKIILTNNEFPVLKSGSTSIAFSGGITKVEVTPKWWTL